MSQSEKKENFSLAKPHNRAPSSVPFGSESAKALAALVVIPKVNRRNCLKWVDKILRVIPPKPSRALL